LASLVLCVLLLCGTFLFPLILAYFGQPDWGAIFGTYIGLLLCSMSFISAGLFSSSVIDEPVAAGLGGTLLLLPFWLSGIAAGFVDEGIFQSFLEEVSFLNHLEPFSKGLLDSVDLLWFVLFTFSFLALTWRSIESRRWR